MAKLLQVKDCGGRLRWINLDFVVEVRAIGRTSELTLSVPLYFDNKEDDKILFGLTGGEHLRRTVFAKQSVAEIAALMACQEHCP